MSRHRRWVQPGELQNPEAGSAPLETPEDFAQLENRTGEDEPEAPVVNDAMAARLAAARALEPDRAHWASAWASGRDAVVTAIEGGATDARVAVGPPPDTAGCRDCWRRGRDAALKVVTGEE